MLGTVVAAALLSATTASAAVAVSATMPFEAQLNPDYGYQQFFTTIDAPNPPLGNFDFTPDTRVITDIFWDHGELIDTHLTLYWELYIAVFDYPNGGYYFESVNYDQIVRPEIQYLSDNHFRFSFETPKTHYFIKPDYCGPTPCIRQYASLLVTDFSAIFDSQDPVGGDITFTITPVPEPSTWAMLIAGFAAVGGALRCGRRSVAF